jgi:phospholipid/cholesterol/gamma-HCH transport system substrate-binding protein
MPEAQGSPEQGSRTGAARLAAVGALVVALFVVAGFALLGGGGYEVQARFVNASQLVNGNEVTVAGERVGTVKDIELTDDGAALVTLEVSDDVAPLRAGTRAIVKQRSLSGVANRFVELQLGQGTGEELAEGATIPGADTESAVDLDQVFNTFDAPTREGVQRTIRLLRDFSRGNEDDARQALRYLDPALSSSSALFAELNRNRRDLEGFIVETGKLVTDLSARDDDLAGVVANLGTTMQALASRRAELGRAIETLPDFLRRSNTTFVNLRATLGDLDPLVAEARPVVREDLPRLLARLRPFARDAAPAVRDLSRTIRRPGADNDLVELLNRQPAVDRVANRRAQRNGEERPGAFETLSAASKRSLPVLNYLRAYAPDLVGWFDDFSRSGVYDALGGFSRAGLALNQFTLQPTVENATSPITKILPVAPQFRDLLAQGGLVIGRNNRCPGSAERAVDGSNPYVPEGIECDKTQVPVGR